MAKFAIVCTYLIFILFGQSVLANVPLTDPTKVETQTKLEFLKNFKGKNEIKLLNNRFRVDYEVEEVMMLFFRKHGSAPVVLVQPDGSKLYPRDSNGKTIEWHADLSYDLIKLKQPMPGPWQAVGKILADSRILVLSDIELLADTLPDQVFQYERIKGEARILNAKEIINDRNFRDVITLKASLYPSSNADMANFGSDIDQLGEFKDDGRELDERPRDGVFTLQYDLDIGHGEWTPKYRVATELFTRELTQEPITVLPLPISYELEEAGEEERYHYVTIVIDDTLIQNDSLLIDGEIRFPSRDTERFNLSSLQDRRLKIFNPAFGTYQITMEMYATTKDGREFKLLPPPYQFLTVEPEAAPEEIELPMMTEMPTEEVVVEEPEPEFPIVLVIIINIFILLFGFLVIWLFVLKRNIPNPFSKIKLANKKKAEPEDKPADKKEQPKESKTEDIAEELDGSDDILDLSLPED